MLKIETFYPVFPLTGFTDKAFFRLSLWSFKEKASTIFHNTAYFFLFAPSDALGNQDTFGFGEAEGGSEAFSVVGSANDVVQAHGSAEQAHVLVGGTRMHGGKKLFAVFLGVGDVHQPYRGFADKALPGEEAAQVGGSDLFEAVFRGVVEPCPAAAEDVDFKILPVLGRGDGSFPVGAVHAVRGPEQIAEQFV